MDVQSLLRHLLAWLLHLGLFGPLLLGIADSSFLFLPFGNDLLVVILTVRNHAHLALYVVTAAIGSTLGVLLLDAVCRKGGEEGLKKMMKPRRLEYFKRRMSNQASVAIGLACLAPPPFPFTLVIASASAFAYPRQRLLGSGFRRALGAIHDCRPAGHPLRQRHPEDSARTRNHLDYAGIYLAVLAGKRVPGNAMGPEKPQAGMRAPLN